jgi:uncharacterized protein YjbI with pentapeptide repeats
MSEDRRPAGLQGHSFQGQSLRGRDFTGADIRGANFSRADLTGANLSRAQAGIRPRSVIGLALGGLLLSLLSGLVIGYLSSLGAFIWNPLPEALTILQQRILPWVAVGLLGLLFLIVLRRGFGAALVNFALAVAFFAVLAAIVFWTGDIGATMALIMLIAGGGMAGAVALAVSGALVQALAGARVAWLALLIAIAGAIAGIAEGVFGALTQPGSISRDASLLIAGAVAAAFLAISIYIGRRGLAGDQRYALVRTLVIGLLTRTGTSFRKADLTDADFTGARLADTDLRDAVLVHTTFAQAVNLDRARTEGTYLARPAVVQLVTTLTAAKGDFDGLNLHGVNLSGANLTEASFIGANLGQAVLRAANLSRAKLVHTQLHDADLSGACLTGAHIEDWGLSTKTRLDDIRCEYVYMRLPTDQDPDPWRKPDNKLETFREGDFADFIAPILKTLDLYRQQEIDPRAVGQAYKTLDLFHHEDINAMASVIALAKLAERHPAAGLEVTALEGRGKDKIRVQTTVALGADRSALGAEYGAIYDEIKQLPQARQAALLAEVAEKDARIRSLEDMVATALKTEKFYVETYINLGGPVTSQIKCLFLAANPSGTQPLRLDREIREITEKIRASEYRDALQLVSAWAVRPGDLLQVLNQHRPQIVHFSGHSTSAGEIVLEDDTGAGKAVSAAALKTLFTTLKDDIRLVILNACYAEIQARAITEVIDCAIGMSAAITDIAAITFIASFYRALGFGRSIREAFDQGVTALMLEGISEETIPKLLLRAGVHPESIVLVEPLSQQKAERRSG